MERKSSGPLRPWRRLRARRTASLRDRGCEGLAQGHQLVPGGVHDVDVLGQRLAQRLGQGLAPPVGHQPAPDLVLDLGPELVDAGLELVPQQSLLQGGQRDRRAAGRRRVVVEGTGRGPGLGHQPLQHAVEVEVPQRPVEVVGPPDRPARLHAGVAADTAWRATAATMASLAPSRALYSRSASSSGVIPSPPPPPRPVPGPAGRPWPCIWPASSVAGGPASSCVVVDPVLGPAQREVDLEGRLVGPPVGRRLHQAGPEGVLDRLAVLQGHVAAAPRPRRGAR